MAADGTQIKQDIDTDLANKGYRGVRTWMIIATLKKVVDWVTGVINGNQTTWFKAGTTTPAGANSDDVARTGKVIMGRLTDDGTGSTAQIEGYAYVKEGLFATNAQNYTPIARAFGGQAILQLLCNWALPGNSDLALLLTNPNSHGLGLWQLTANAGKTLLGYLKGGSLGLGTTDPKEVIDAVGFVRSYGLAASGGLPTITAGAGLGTGGSASILAGSTDTAGRIRLVTGSSNVNGNALQAAVTFNKTFDVAPRFALMYPRNQAAAREIGKVYVDGMSTSQCIFYGSGGTAFSASMTFDFDYFIIK